MVYHHFPGLAAHQHRVHLVETAHASEIKTEHEVGLIKSLLHLLGMPVISQDTITSRQPGKGIRYHIRHTNHGILAQGAQIIGPTQRRTDGITIRRLMRTDDNTLRSRYHLTENSGFLICYLI